MQQPRAVQVQTVAARTARQLLQPPPPQRTKTAQVDRGVAEVPEKPGEARLAGDPLDRQQGRDERVAAQVRDLRQLLRPSEDAGDKTQREILHRQRLAAGTALRGTLGQGVLEQPAQRVPVQETGETGQPGPAADFLIGETNAD